MSAAIMQKEPLPVLIIRLDGIGDALALAPLLAGLRERAIPVDLVLRRENAGIFSPRAARRIEIAPFALRSSSAENLRLISDFAATLAPRNYESVLVATEDPGGYRLARAIGAPERIGFDNGWGKPLKTLWVRSMLTRTLYRPAGLEARGRHECEVLFELGRSLLGDAQPTRALDALRPLLIEREPARDERVAVQVTEKWRLFGISPSDVAALITRLARARGVRAIASAREASFAGSVADAGIVVERFDALEPWKAAIAAARALVAPDSGALGVAGMLGTPTVALFPPQRRFERQIARWHPWAAPYRIVRLENGWPQRALCGLEELLA
ncbi:MAG TPA: hypothetical protein VIN40_03895 [Candidatus Tyrphobacter sp.]